MQCKTSFAPENDKRLCGICSWPNELNDGSVCGNQRMLFTLCQCNLMLVWPGHLHCSPMLITLTLCFALFTDIDECVVLVMDVCEGENTFCENTIGSFECLCESGFSKDDSGNLVIWDYLIDIHVYLKIVCIQRKSERKMLSHYFLHHSPHVLLAMGKLKLIGINISLFGIIQTMVSTEFIYTIVNGQWGGEWFWFNFWNTQQ